MKELDLGEPKLPEFGAKSNEEQKDQAKEKVKEEDKKDKVKEEEKKVVKEEEKKIDEVKFDDVHTDFDKVVSKKLKDKAA